MNELIYHDYVSVLKEGTFFNKEKANEWRKNLVDSYNTIYYEMQDILDNSSLIRFYVDKALLDETIIDAIIGMRKIVESSNNNVENPNSFKIAAYLSYWWLRHKPVSIYYGKDYDLRDVTVKRMQDDTDEEFKEKNLKFIWNLKHINEIVAVQFAMNYIFDFSQPVCDDRYFKKACKKCDNFESFESFEDMYEIMNKKLLYYFSYRAIAPKIIEQILESYTMHPAWKLSGNHWNSK